MCARPEWQEIQRQRGKLWSVSNGLRKGQIISSRSGSIFAAMFPASLLLPSVGVFLASRSSRKRSLRSKDLGFLSCGAVWILVFFSAASCKLPTYILPATPLLCLMTGVMLDQTAFRRGAIDRITTHLRPFPQSATLVLVASCVTLIGVDIWIGGQLSMAAVVASLACVPVFAVTVWHWNRKIALGHWAWPAMTAVATGVLLFASSVVLPTIWTERSVSVATLRTVDAVPDSRIVFLARGHTVRCFTCRLTGQCTFRPSVSKISPASSLSSVILCWWLKTIESIRLRKSSPGRMNYRFRHITNTSTVRRESSNRLRSSRRSARWIVRCETT